MVGSKSLIIRLIYTRLVEGEASKEDFSVEQSPKEIAISFSLVLKLICLTAPSPNKLSLKVSGVGDRYSLYRLPIKESFLVRSIKKPAGVGAGTRTGIGTGVSLSISREVATSIGNQGALESGLYIRIISIKVNN